MLILTLVFLAVVIRQIVKMRKENELLKDKLEYTENLKKVFETDAKEYYIRVIQLEDKIKKMKKET